MSYLVVWSQAAWYKEPAESLEAAKGLVLRVFPEAVFCKGSAWSPDTLSGRERQEAFLWLVDSSGHPVGEEHWHAVVPDTPDARRRSGEHAARHIAVNR